MLSDNRLLTPGGSFNNSKTLFMYDLDRGEATYTMEGHSYDIGLIALTADECRAATATKDTVSSSGCGPKNARVWDLTTGKQVSWSGACCLVAIAGLILGCHTYIYI